MKNATIKIPKNPEKLSSFFCLRWAVLVLIAITGIRYNVGMLANPIFLGRLIDGIESKDSTRKSIGFLLISYVSAILLIQHQLSLLLRKEVSSLRLPSRQN